MKLIYEAPNALEAHMILNLLEQAGLSARIDGEYLQGGVGELQAIGAVRVMVDEADLAEAQRIIEQWDAKQAIAEPQPESQRGTLGGFASVAVGFLFGAAVVAAFYNTPITDDGIDHNGDGVIDEKWTFVNYRLAKSEVDRNFDGQIDLVYTFDRKGLLEASQADNDFNGSMETEASYRYGNAVWQKSDTDGDGFKDYQMDFSHGVMSRITFINPANGKPIKIQDYGPFILKRAHVDTTGDGYLDTVFEYDALEEVSASRQLNNE